MKQLNLTILYIFLIGCDSSEYIKHIGNINEEPEVLVIEDGGSMPITFTLKTGEETDKLRDLQTDGIEIQNMMMLQQMGFEVTRTHTGEFKVSKNSAMTPELMFGVGAINGNMNGVGKGKPAPQESQQQFAGEPNNKRPSDIGGTGQGSPTSGSSMSKKSFPKGITPSNFDVVKKTLQTAIDFDWKKTKTVEELRKATGMTVRDARDIVTNEFADIKRWEDNE